MKALIITDTEGEDLEVLYPYYRLQEEKIEVHVASSKKEPEKFDILVIPGGRGPEKVRLNKYAVELTRNFFNKNKPVAAICHGPQVLISANLLKGRTVTSWMGIKDDVVAAGGSYRDEPVIRDGNLVTSRMPSDLPAWMNEFNLQAIGASLIFIGMVVMVLATITKLKEMGGGEDTKIAGVIMIGPIPIAFGNSRKLLMFLLAIVIVVFLVYFIFTF